MKFTTYEEESSELLNLTPLLDVLFVVLILFMLAAPLLQVDKVELTKGATVHEDFSDSGGSPIKITLTSKNEILVQNRSIPPKLLVSTFTALKKEFPHLSPVIYCDKNGSFGTYQALKNALEEAGFNEMDVILKAH